jgi:SAM-dependent methyltransferase
VRPFPAMPPPADAWNHNLHYYPVLVDAGPARCERALDVGCGEGLLALALRRRAGHVTGIDLDPASIEQARRDRATPGVDFLVGDLLTHPFEPASFDHIASIAVLHHMDATAGLERMRHLLAPGGTLSIVGLARNRYPADLPFAIAGAAGHRIHRLSKPYWEDAAPRLWPPPDTFTQTRRLAQRLLPGVRYRRLLLFRYSLVWTKPAHAT